MGSEFIGDKPVSSQSCNTQCCTVCSYATGSSSTYWVAYSCSSSCYSGMNSCSTCNNIKIVHNGTVVYTQYDNLTVSSITYNVYTYTREDLKDTNNTDTGTVSCYDESYGRKRTYTSYYELYITKI